MINGQEPQGTGICIWEQHERAGVGSGTRGRKTLTFIKNVWTWRIKISTPESGEEMWKTNHHHFTAGWTILGKRLLRISPKFTFSQLCQNIKINKNPTMEQSCGATHPYHEKINDADTKDSKPQTHSSYQQHSFLIPHHFISWCTRKCSVVHFAIIIN